MKKITDHIRAEWYKYLLEILVIVIGIYGAFVLDNWNEARKDREKERTLLINLKRDFELRQFELLEFKDARKKAMTSIKELSKAIANQGATHSKAKLDSCLVSLFNSMTFNDQFKMLDVLFSTGMINELQDEELKERLLLWPQQVEEMMEEQRERGMMDLQHFQPLTMKYIAVREIYELMTFRQYIIPKGTTTTFATDYPGLLADPSFERYLAYLESLHVVNEIDSNILLENAEIILERLEEGIRI